MTATKLTANSSTAVTLVEGNGGTDDSLDTNGFTLTGASTKVPVNLTLTNAPATSTGVLITNSGTITGNSSRVIDAGAATNGTGEKVTLINTGTITSTGAGGPSSGVKGDLFRIAADLPQGTVTVTNLGTMAAYSDTNDSQGLRFGKIYTASAITITNGSATNSTALISTANADAIRPGGVDPTNSNTNFGSVSITNYGTIAAHASAAGSGSGATAQLNAQNAIDISVGQSVALTNSGTITADESALGSDVGAGTLTFLSNYNVTNTGTITGYNGDGIASGTATVTNSGTITGSATGTITGVLANSGNTATGPVAIANAAGVGILTTSTATITNNVGGVIQGTGAIGNNSAGTANVSYAIDIGNGTITNYGTISETATAANRGNAAILVTGTIASTVSNYGTISSVAGLAITMGGGNDTVNLYTGGTITGTIDGGAGIDTLTLNTASGATATGTLSKVANFEILNVTGGAWTITDAESYSSGVTIASGANLIIGPNGSTSAAITDNGTLTYTETGTFTKAEAITGTGNVVQAGTGTLVLTNGSNTYSGGTTLTSGTLDVTTAGAAGTGAITFGTGTQTLDIEQAALNSNGSFTNTLSGVGAEDFIDVRGIGAATGTTFNANTNQLTITGGSQTVTLQLDASDAPAAGYAYGVSADNNTTSPGTLVALDQIATIQNVTSSPSTGYAKAGSTITLTLTTSKAVFINGTAPVLQLSNGGTAIYDSADSTSTSLIFKSTVANGQDSNGVTVTAVTNASSVQDQYDVPVNFVGATSHAAVGPTIDTVAPVVNITSQSGLTNQATQTVTGTDNVTSDNGATVNIYETINGTATLLGSTTVSNGAWSKAVNLSGNGAHTLSVQETDNAGNTGTSSISYDLETTAPPVTITSSGGLTNKTAQTITGQVDVSTDPEAKMSPITVTDNTTGQIVGSGTVNNDGSFSVGVTLTGDGSHTLQVSDTDQANNVGYATTSYTLDTMPPAPPTVALTNDTGTSSTDKITNNPAITYTPSASGDTLLYAVDGATTYTTTTPTFAVDGSQDGSHTVSVKEQDPAGNIGAATSLTFTLDTVAPTTAPTVSLAHDTGSSQTDNITSNAAINAAVGTAGDTLLYAADGAATYTTTLPVFTTDGTHTLSVKEEDTAGNVGPAASLSFTLDTTPPSAPSLSLVADTGGSNTDNVTSNPGIAYALSASGDTLLYSSDGSTYSTTKPVFKTDGTADGQHTVSIKEQDVAGNISAAKSLTFTLDTTPPDVDFTSLGGTVNKATQIVNGMVGVEDAGTTVSVYQDGSTTASATAVVNASGYWSASVTLNGPGSHILTASDTDKAGNTGGTDDSLTYNYDPTVPTFTPGNLVISISGNGDGSGNYGDNQATPLVLQQITTDGTYVSQIVLPQTTTTVNGVTESVISAEYGSSSEGSLQLSADGHSLVIAGYGINAATYNAGGAAVYGNAALAQSTSLQGGPYTAVSRVIADINANGTIDTSTSLFNVYNGNNPRSVATIDGSTFYISGQGIKGDTTQGLFLVQDGSTTATSLDHTTDTRTAEIYNGQLYVSRDSKQGTGGTSNIAVYGPGLPTTATTGTILKGISQTVLINAANGNTINASAIGTTVALDPNNFFFANANTLYVADGGIPKQGGLGDGGLQKWTYNGTQWTLQYTLSQGLNIISGNTDEGTTGLIGLTGKVVGDTVQLYATNQTIGDTDQKYVFGINDSLSSTTGAGESFTTLVTAAPDTNIRGIAFAPTPITPTVKLVSDTGVSNTDNITSNAALAYTKAISGDTLLYSADGVTYSTTAPVFNTDGTYTISVEEKDKGGTIGPATSLTFTRDTTADAGGDLAVSVPSGVNAANANAASFTVSGLDADATGTVTFTGVSSTDGSTKIVTVTAASNGTGTVNLSGLKDGTITVGITATDVAGNSATGAGSSTFLDTTADVGHDLAVTFGTNAAVTGDVNAANAANASFTVAGLDTDAVATVTFTGASSVDGSAKSTTFQETANGTFSVDLSGFKDGTITAAITATDTAGNNAIGKGTSTMLDTTADAGGDLAVTFGTNAAVPGDVNKANAKAASFTVAGLDSDATATVTFTGASSVDGSAKTVTMQESTNGTFSANLNGFQDGTITASITATDAAGNSATGAGTSAVLDTTADAGGDLAVTFGTNASVTGDVNAANAKTASFAVAGLDSDATATVTFSGTGLNGSARSVTSSVGANGTGTVDLSGFKDGTITAGITATDTAGNIAPGAGTSTVLDTTADAGGDLAVTFGTNAAVPGDVNAADAAQASFVVAGLDSDATATVTFMGTATDGTSRTVTASVATNGALTADLSGFKDGTITATIAATDAVGNSANGRGTSTVLDTTADAGGDLAVTFGTNAAISGDVNATNASKASFAVTGLDSDATALVSFTGTGLNGSAKTVTSSVTANGTGTVNLSGFRDGTIASSIVATDVAGNSAPGTGTSTLLDTTADAGADLAVTFGTNAAVSGDVNKANATAASFTVAGIDSDATALVTFTGTGLNGSPKTVTASANVNGTQTVDLSGFKDGTITAGITATDTAGNTAKGTGTSTVLDTTADVGSDLAVSFGTANAAIPGDVNAAHAAATSFSVAGLDSDATATVTFTGASSVDGSAKTVTMKETGNGTFSVNLSGFQDGTITAAISAVDTAGNTASGAAGATIVLDATAPPQPAAPTLTLASDTGASSTDGITSVTTPTVTGTAEAGSTVTLFDGTTKLVSTVAGANGAYSITSPVLASGSHTLTVTATDAAGNVSLASPGKAVVIDTLAPATPSAPTLTAASDTGASSTDGITSITTPTVTGTAEAGSTVTLFDGSINVGATTAASNGTFSITSSALGEGSHTLKVTATDTAGNVSQASSALSILIDTTAPGTPTAPTLTAASDTGLSSTDGITKVTTPTITGTAEVGSTVTLFDGSTKLGSTVAGSNGAYSITAPSLAAGSHTLTVTATDTAGNVSQPSAGKVVVIDTTAPSMPATPTLTAASDSGISSIDGITSVMTPTVVGTAEAGSTVTLFDGSTKLGSTVAGSNGSYSIATPVLATGSHTLTVTATDAAGNVSQPSTGKIVVIDTTAPTTPGAPTLTAASDTGVSSTDGITSVTTPTVTGTAEAGSTITLFDGSTAVGTTTAATNGSYSVTASALSSGSHTLSVTATDAAGNVSAASAGRTILIDNVAPSTPGAPALTAASDTGISSTDGITKVTAPTVTGTADPGSIVTLFDGSTKVGSAIAGSTGAYSITSSALVNGSHTLTVTATDTAGNISQASTATIVVVDTSAPATPAAPTLSGSSTGSTASLAPTLTGTAEAGSTVTLFDGTTKVGSTVANSGGAYTITSSTLTNGTHKFDVTATDAAGNVSTASAVTTVIIDGTPPATPAAPTLAAASDTGISSTDGNTKNATPTFTGTAEAGATVTLFDGSTSVGTAVAASNGAYSVKASSVLADGSHTLHVTATDAAGNVSGSSAGKMILIDTLAPTTPPKPTLSASSDTGASSSDGITKDTTPTVTGTADPGSIITLLDGTKAVGTATASSTGAYTITASALAAGVHTLSVTATDIAGNISQTSPGLSVTIATVAATPAAPTLAAGSDSGASQTDGITNVTTPTFTGTVSAGATVTLYDGTKVVGTALANGTTGAYSITSSMLATGSHALKVTATDLAGNLSAASATRTVVIDTTPPTTPAAPTLAAASDTGASSTDGITNDTTPTLTGTASAGVTISLYDTDGTTLLGTAIASSTGAYAVTSSALAEGSHTLSVKATDAAGNVSAISAGRTIVIDTTPLAAPSAPVLAAVSDTGSSSTDGITKVTTPTFTGTAAAGATVLLLEGTKVLGTAVATSNGLYTITSAALANGSHTLITETRDVAGNLSAASAGTTITIDTLAPAAPTRPALTAASDSGASQTDGITNVTTPTFTGTAEIGSTVTLYDGTKVVGTGTAGSNGTYTIATSTLANGAHSITVKATDTAGNTSVASTARAITIDTTPPALTVATTGGATTVSAHTVSGTGEVGRTIVITDNSNNSNVVSTATVASNGTWSKALTLSGAGTHTIVASETDIAGNTTTRQLQYDYSPAASANMASFHSMVQAMSTMSSSSSTAMTPTASSSSGSEHPLAAAH